MARLLYRILRVINFVASVEETQLRSAMRSSTVMNQLQRLIVADFDKPLSYAAPLTGSAMAPGLNGAIVGNGAVAHDRVRYCFSARVRPLYAPFCLTANY